ncbi:MAG TPA: hypothetical protein VGM67_11760 [Gemmatimonadaceae bacterium]|jgi:hypothetical protein
MTLAVATPTPTSPTISHTIAVAILGTDALLAALPATPVQLAHACMQAGFANVIPASWGDELIAAGTLRRLAQFGDGPVIHCSCPIVAHRLLTVGADLRPALLPLIAPPVAVSRYLRTLAQPGRLRVTYVGNCPGALDESIDIRMTPDALIAMLSERQIVVDDQPLVFESVIPPDRRRFLSQPGGLPAADALWNEHGSRTLVEVGGEDVVTELVQHLLNGKNILIDAATQLGCHCSGAGGAAGVGAADARSVIVALEPPRAAAPVVEERAPIDLDSHIPVASRTPIDVAAVPAGMVLNAPLPVARASEAPLGQRSSPGRGVAVLEPRPPRASSPGMTRPVQGTVPVSRDVEGRSLPRAYVARRRSSPRGMPAIAPDDVLVSPKAKLVTAEPQPAATARADAAPVPSATTTLASIAWPLPSRQLLYLIVSVLVLVAAVSATVAAIVEHSISTPPVASTAR